MSRRYIELASGYRNRNQWPCPSEFVTPIDCINKSDSPLDASDPLALSYPEYAWYQMPYAAPLWVENTPGITSPRPRKINGMYYTSLWPLVPSLEQPLPTASKDSGWLGAMKFSGGTFEKPMLNAVVTTPPNEWSALVGNISYNPYYTPKKDYFTGAMLICFTEDPSCYLNSWNNSQIVNIAAAFAPPANIGVGIEQPGVGAIGTIVCIISPTSFVVTLQNTSNPFDPSGGNINVPTSGASSAAGGFSTAIVPAYSYDGQVETSIITGYDPNTGFISLKNPLSKDFDPSVNYYLIDFNTDPNNDWSDYVSSGARIFVPGGSSAPQAYEGLYFQNYTLSSDETNKDVGSKVIKYDFTRRIAYLDKPLQLKQKSAPANFSFFGSDTFTIRKNKPIATKTYPRISVNDGSILDLRVLKSGSGYKVGEIIGTSFSVYYESPGVVFAYPPPNYNLNNNANQGVAFRAEITNVDVNGGILKIKVIQQGAGFYRGSTFNITANIGSGLNAVLYTDNVYQSVELLRNSNVDSVIPLKKGNYIFLPNYGKIGSNGLTNTSTKVAPTIPRYFFPDNTDTSILDIRQNGYPPSILGCDVNNVNVPEDGIYQIISSFTKNVTFGDWFAAGTGFAPVTVLYLAPSSINLSVAGLTNNGTPAFINNGATFPYNSGYIVQQQLEFLQYDGDNLHALNFTGTRVSQNQMCCFEIKLLNITLPNIPLDNNIGGLIAFYPFLYVELSNVNAPSRGNRGIIYSNNPNANKATFRVNVDDTNTPLRSKFIKLDGDGAVQTVKFRPNDDLYFRVFLPGGELFETVTTDTSPPLQPNVFVQITAQFQIRKIGPEVAPKPASRKLHLRRLF